MIARQSQALLAGFMAAFALAGCTIIPPAEPRSAPLPPPSPPQEQASESAGDDQAPLTYAALGQSVYVDGPRVTPLEVLEDSRCPMNARCVWAGQVRLRIRIDLGSGSATREITSGKPLQIADGSLELVEIRPDRVAGGESGGVIDPGTYRFGFRFMGGL